MSSQFDIRHAVCEGNRSWVTAMQLLAEKIGSLAIKDFTWDVSGGQSKVKKLPLGEGIVDFDVFFKNLKTFGVVAPITLHVEHVAVGHPGNLFANSKEQTLKNITIKTVDSNFEREPLIRPFGFKGGYMSEIWQTISYLESTSGQHQIGLCTQNVLWSDANVFANNSESAGNALMYAITERAQQMIKGQSFASPVDLLDEILPEVYAYAKKVTSNPNLRKTLSMRSKQPWTRVIFL